MQLTYAYSIFIYEPGSINSLVLGDGRPPTFNDGNPYNGYINPYYSVDDHPLLYGNIGSLDPSTYNIDFALYTKQRSGSHIDFDRNIIDFGLNLHKIHLRNGLSIRALCKPCTRGRGRHCCIRRHGLIAIKAILYAIVLCRVITTSM